MQTDFHWGDKIAQETAKDHPPGTTVFAPYRDPSNLQPWIHGRHKGTILAVDDPKAWAGSLAFPKERPNRAKVHAHVVRCLEQGLLQGKVPVRWSFGKIYWETLESLRPWAPMEKTS